MLLYNLISHYNKSKFLFGTLTFFVALFSGTIYSQDFPGNLQLITDRQNIRHNESVKVTIEVTPYFSYTPTKTYYVTLDTSLFQPLGAVQWSGLIAANETKRIQFTVIPKIEKLRPKMGIRASINWRYHTAYRGWSVANYVEINDFSKISQFTQATHSLQKSSTLSSISMSSALISVNSQVNVLEQCELVGEVYYSNASKKIKGTTLTRCAELIRIKK